MSDLEQPKGSSPSRAQRTRTGRGGSRAERAEARRSQLDSSVPSPCIAICQLDPKTNHCIGCLRSVEEIREWMIMSADEKKAVLARIEERKAAL